MRRNETRKTREKREKKRRKKRGKEKKREERNSEETCVPVRRATTRHRQTGTLEVGWIHNLSLASLSGLAGSRAWCQMSEEPTVSILALRTRQKPDNIMSKQPKKTWRGKVELQDRVRPKQRCPLQRTPSDRYRRQTHVVLHVVASDTLPSNSITDILDAVAKWLHALMPSCPDCPSPSPRPSSSLIQ